MPGINPSASLEERVNASGPTNRPVELEAWLEEDRRVRQACGKIGNPSYTLEEQENAEQQLLSKEPQLAARYLAGAFHNPLTCWRAAETFLKLAEKDPKILRFAVAASKKGTERTPPDEQQKLEVIAYVARRILRENPKLVPYLTKGLADGESRAFLEGLLIKVGNEYPWTIRYICFGLQYDDAAIRGATTRILSRLPLKPTLERLIDRVGEPRYLEGICDVVRQDGLKAIEVLLIISAHYEKRRQQRQQDDVLKVLHQLGPDYPPLGETALERLRGFRTLKAAEATMEEWKNSYAPPQARAAS